MQSKAWFVSDLHFHHVGALRFHPERCKESGVPFESVLEDKEMGLAKYDAWLIEKWNSIIKKRDYVYILGDLSLGNKECTENILRQLNGYKFLIRGNHDKSCIGLEHYFSWVGDIKEVKFNHDQYPFIQEGETFACELCHFPLLTWNRRPHGSVMVHGHTHGGINNINIESEELRVDVGYDGDFAKQFEGFVPLEELYNYMRKIVTSHGFNAFQEYIDWKMKQDGFRM